MACPSPTTRCSTLPRSREQRAMGSSCASKRMTQGSTRRGRGSFCMSSTRERWRMSTNRLRGRVGVLMILVGLGLLLMSCTQHMAVQPRYQPYQPSELFADGASARPPPPDTVARGHLQDDRLLFTGED